jgi:ferritin
MYKKKSPKRLKSRSKKQTTIKNTKNQFVSNKANKLLQYRINEEENSSRVYLSMSLWLENKGYTNSAKLWKKYSEEESKHADWARDYLLSFGIQPETQALNRIPSKYKGLPEIIYMTYNHERTITNQIKELANYAMNSKDHMLYELSLKYLKEQVEEHSKTQNLVDQLESFGTDQHSLRLFDQSLK